MFNCIINALTNEKSRSFCTQKVDDCIVGSLKYTQSKGFVKNNQKPFFSEDEPWEKKGKNNAKNILIVLESPHNNEYNTAGAPLRPAMGNTGRQLKDCIEDKLNLIIKNKKLKYGNYNLWLIDAIQYQCSLGITPIQKGLRNVIFRILWKELKSDFISRIEKLNPIIIVNLCTGGMEAIDDWSKKKYNPLEEPALNVLVQEAISESAVGKKAIKFYGTHPASGKFKSTAFKEL